MEGGGKVGQGRSETWTINPIPPDLPDQALHPADKKNWRLNFIEIKIKTYSLSCCLLNWKMIISRNWKLKYETVADVPESWVWLRADFQSGSRVLKKVFWTFSYLYLRHTMWFHAEKLLKTLEIWKSLNLLCKSGSRPQKSPKKSQKRITQSQFTQIFWIGMVYFGCHLVNPHVQTVQNMYGKGR